MKTLTKAAITILVVLIGLTSAQTPPKEAANTNSAVQPTPVASVVPAAPEDFLFAGQNVEVKPEGINGDAAMAGTNVKIGGNVRGYALAAGMNVNVEAPVGNDLWAVGSNVTVAAPIADNAMLAGSNIILEQNGTIGKDARIAGANVDIKGRINRNLFMSAGNAQIYSEIGGNVTAHTEYLTLHPGAVINGDLVVYSPNPPVVSSLAKVTGRVDHRLVQRESESSATSRFSSWFLRFLWMAILGIVMVSVSSVWTNRVAEMIRTSPGMSVLTGFVAAIVVPVACLILLVTVIGLPLAFVAGALFLIALMLSGAFVSYFVGGWVLAQLKRWQNSNIAKVIVGALIVTIACALPWIGWLAWLAVVLFGFGAFLLERRDLFRKLRAEGLA